MYSNSCVMVCLCAIVQATDLLTGLTSQDFDNDDHPSHAPKLSAEHLGKLYVFALMWSVGALLELSDRAKMEGFLVQQNELHLPPTKEGETIFEYVVNSNGEWEHWSTRVQEYIYPTDRVPEYASILVPNVDNVCTTFLIDTIAKQHKVNVDKACTHTRTHTQAHTHTTHTHHTTHTTHMHAHTHHTTHTHTHTPHTHIPHTHTHTHTHCHTYVI